MTSSSQSEPASRSFVFMLRNLERARRYVPPYQQPTPVAPMGAAPLSSRAAGDQTGALGAWVLGTNDRGDLVARHDSGYEQVLAAVPDAAVRDTESENNDG